MSQFAPLTTQNVSSYSHVSGSSTSACIVGINLSRIMRPPISRMKQPCIVLTILVQSFGCHTTPVADSGSAGPEYGPGDVTLSFTAPDGEIFQADVRVTMIDVGGSSTCSSAVKVWFSGDAASGQMILPAPLEVGAVSVTGEQYGDRSALRWQTTSEHHYSTFGRVDVLERTDRELLFGTGTTTDCRAATEAELEAILRDPCPMSPDITIRLTHKTQFATPWCSQAVRPSTILTTDGIPLCLSSSIYDCAKGPPIDPPEGIDTD